MKPPRPDRPRFYEASDKDAQGYDQNRTAAKQGGDVAGKARKDLEAKSGKKVLSSKNYLQTKQNPALEK